MSIGQSAGVDQFENVGQATVSVFRLIPDRDLGCPQSLFLDLPGLLVAAGQAERLDRTVQFGQIHSGVDQCAEHHVAANTARAIQVGQFHIRVLKFVEGVDGLAINRIS